jgi:hypothetical protein
MKMAAAQPSEAFGVLEARMGNHPEVRAILEAVESMDSVVSGWRFLREPNHPLLEHIPAGGLLFKTRSLLGLLHFGVNEPWSVYSLSA